MSEHRRVTTGEIREQLDALEERYGVPSERMTEVVPDDADPCANEELSRWSKLYHAWTQEDADE